MSLLTNVKNVATVVANSPKTPKALLIFGGVAIIGGTVWACVQTAKADKIVDDFKETIDDIKGMKEDGVFVDDDGNEQEYSQKSYTHDMIWAYGGFAKDMAIHYAGPVACLVGGITAIGMGYKLQINKILKLQGEIMSLNNEIVTLGAVAANAEENFRKYRDNVIADGGEELDEKYTILDIMVFAEFSNDQRLNNQITPLRNITNTIIETYQQTKNRKKDMISL